MIVIMIMIVVVAIMVVRPCMVATLHSVNQNRLMFFTQRLAMFVRRNLSVHQGLTALIREARGSFRWMLKKVTKEISGGKTLWSSLASYPKYFSRRYVGMVRVGERSGRLAETMQDLLEYEEMSRVIKSEVAYSLIYPMYMCLTLTVIPLGIEILIFPKFEEMFMELAIPLSPFFRFAHWLFIAVICAFILFAVILIGVAVFRFIEDEIIRRFLPDLLVLTDMVKWVTPLVHGYEMRCGLMRYSQALGAALRGGATVNEAMSLAEDVGVNAVLQRRFERARGLHEEGNSLSESYRKGGGLSRTFCWLVATGEGAGTLPDSLKMISRIYSEWTIGYVRYARALVVPVFALIGGSAVGVFAYACFSPLVTLMNAM